MSEDLLIILVSGETKNFKGKNKKGKEIDIGSCAGGRYNSLIKRFSKDDFKGTGMSIGLIGFDLIN